jgi:hypothetical protein
MIKNKVYRLKQAAEVAPNMSLPSGQEIEVVMDVVYVNGHMVPPMYQELFINWLQNNPSLFEDDTRDW